jgi:hydrogenase maturation factor
MAWIPILLTRKLGGTPCYPVFGVQKRRETLTVVQKIEANMSVASFCACHQNTIDCMALRDLLPQQISAA